MSRFTHEEKSNEAQREAGRRRRVSTKLIAEGKMTATDAESLVDVMDEISVDYERAARRGPVAMTRADIAERCLRGIVESSGGVGIAFQMATAGLKDMDSVKK